MTTAGATRIAVCCAVVWALFCGGAAAADYTVHTCHRSGLDALVQSASLWRVSGGATERCPSGFNFLTGTTQTTGTRSTAGYDSPVSHRIKRVVFTFEGGDISTGRRVRLSNRVTLSPFYELPPRSPEDPPLVVDIDTPPLNGFMAYSECVATSCDPSQSPLLHSFEFTFADDAAPVRSSYVDPLSPYPGGPMLNLDGWNRPDIYKLDFHLIDSITGVARVEVSRNGEAPFWRRDDSASPCAFDPAAGPVADPQPCPSSIHFKDPVDLNGLPDGRNELRIFATDAIGNSAFATPVVFHVDGTPPSAPVRVTAADVNANGWTSRSVTPLSWTNPETTEASETNSGLGYAHFDVDPILPGDQDPSPRDVAYGTYDKIDDLKLPYDGEWRVKVWLSDLAGNTGPAAEVVVRRDTDAPPPPRLAAHDWVNAAGLHSGVEQRLTRPSLQGVESGLCGYVSTVNRQPSLNGIAAAASIPADDISFPLDPNVADGVNYVHVAAESCAGLRSAVATVPLPVDATRPDVTLAGLPGSRWSTVPLEVAARAADDGSGVARTWLRETGGLGVEAEGPVVRTRLRDGLHRITYGAADVAGGVTERAAEVGVDTVPPEVVLDSIDPLDPIVVSATVSDALSGVDAAWLEYSRVDEAADGAERAWRSFGEAVYPPSVANNVRVSATLPDSTLPDGTYAVRAVGVDVAGNSAHGTRTAFGDQLLIALPARQSYTLSAKIARIRTAYLTAKGRSCRPSKLGARLCKRRLHVDRGHAASVKRIEYAESGLLLGSLRDHAGHGIAGAELLVYEKPKYGVQQLLDRVRTRADGGYELRLSDRGPSRTLKVVFTGNGVTRGAEGTVELAVEASLSFSLSHRQARAGQTVRFSGRVLSRPETLSPAGRRVTVEYLTDQGWQPLKQPYAFPPDGRFEVDHTFGTRPSKPISFRFRAYLDPQPGWPFEAGRSTTRTMLLTR